MRTIRIVVDGIPTEIYDDNNQPIEEATEYLTEIMKNEKIIRLIGKNSSIILRPSKVSAINILDYPDQEAAEPIKNTEQKSEAVDMIVDIDHEGVE